MESKQVTTVDSIIEGVKILCLVFYLCSYSDSIKDVVRSSVRGGSRVRQTPEEGWRTYRPRRCGNSKKDEENSSKILHNKNHQDSSQKFRQLMDRYKYANI